jgi:RNA polymerase sigma-70 factor, ECF subfamily
MPRMPPESSAEAVERSLASARDGSLEALGSALEACRPYLTSAAAHELSPELWAKLSPSDLVQETFLAAHRDFPRFDGRTWAEWRAWLRTILTNCVRRSARRYRGAVKRSVSHEVPLEHLGLLRGAAPDIRDDSAPDPVEVAIGTERLEAVRSALDRLPERQRRAVALRFLLGLTYRDISRSLGISPTGVRKALDQAIERLRDELSQTRT